MTIELQDKLYTSTQVADILGVSLRTLYRYMEDGRIQSMRTASGRHRFTKDQIVDFLNAGNLSPMDIEKPSPYMTPNNNQQSYPSYGQPMQGNQMQQNYNNQPMGNNGVPYQSDVNQRQMQQLADNFNMGNGMNNMNQPATNGFGDSQNLNQPAPMQPQTDTFMQNQQPQNMGSDLTMNSFFNNQQNQDAFRQGTGSGMNQQAPVSFDDFEDVEDIRMQNDVAPVTPLTPLVTAQDDFLSSEFDFSDRNVPQNNMQSNDWSQPTPAAAPQQQTYSQTEPMQQPINPVAPVAPVQQSEPQSYAAPVAAAAVAATSAAPAAAASGFSIGTQDAPQTSTPESLDLSSKLNVRYYKSEISDLIELARKIKDISKSRDIEYAFTIYAGLSLHYSIKPFTILHFYANPEDMQIWKEDLKLQPVAKREDANVGLIINTDIVFVPNKEISTFAVVDDKILLRDLTEMGEVDLVRTFREKLI